SVVDGATYIFNTVKGVVIEDGGINTWNMSIVAFLLLLGMMTALLTLSGGTRAFADWALVHIKEKRGASLLAAFLGVFIFIDDYFNSLAVGSISKPLTDRHHVSRAKLAYLIDSTAAPICVIMPVSSWGAYIIALVGSIMATHGITDGSPVFSFLSMVSMNLYALFALAMVMCTAAMDLNIGPMAKHEKAALAGKLFDTSKGHPPGTPQLEEDEHGRVSDLVSPILVLVLATIAAMVWTGASELVDINMPFSVLGAFENTNVTSSLIIGGVIGLVYATCRLLNRKIDGAIWQKAIFEGSKSMLPAIYILIFAWVLTGIIGQLETGKYLASLVSGSIMPGYLPVILFIVSGVMAFATGTSWGTFGIMLPIAGDTAAAADTAMMLPMLASVLAGAVFGDHCSPISDTTILSSIGASCHHMDHVNTQLPYA
ncbi:MAG: Na+/H+ antiporter NhaC family protein, partial [Endozoicomonas sp.]